MNKIIEAIRDIDNQLSPENLSCDGEADPRCVRQRAAKLNRERSKLVGKLGREPSGEELWPDLYAMQTQRRENHGS